jgi:hypothetical protein
MMNALTICDIVHSTLLLSIQMRFIIHNRRRGRAALVGIIVAALSIRSLYLSAHITTDLIRGNIKGTDTPSLMSGLFGVGSLQLRFGIWHRLRCHSSDRNNCIVNHRCKLELWTLATGLSLDYPWTVKPSNACSTLRSKERSLVPV